MALIQPGSGEDRATTELAGAVEVEDRIVRDGRQVIARGTLVCPSCDLPLPGKPAVGAARLINCGWCGNSARAREYFRAAQGPPSSRVELVARLGSTAP